MEQSKSKEKFKRKDWYKLDLSAIVYPTLQRKDFSSVYRLSVLMKEEVDPKLLQEALDRTLPRFPTYKAAIRKGLFWRYLEPNDRPGPFVQEDVKNPCQPMYFKANNRYLVRVYYYGRRISLEAHHSLGDGTGGMSVLLTMVATYLRLQGHDEIENGGLVLDIYGEPDEGELEDAYMKYANAKVCPPRLQEKAFHVRGTGRRSARHYVIQRSAAGCQAVQCHHHRISECGVAVFPADQAIERGKTSPAPGEDRHAGEPSEILSLCHAAEFHYNDLSGN